MRHDTLVCALKTALHRHHGAPARLIALCVLAALSGALAAPQPLARPSPAVRAVREAAQALLQARLVARTRARRAGIEDAGRRYGFAPEARATDGGRIAMVALRNGTPIVYQTLDRNAALSVNATPLLDAPTNPLTGAGIIVGVWDEGMVRHTHVELTNRVSRMNTGPTSGHATHVGGTIASQGRSPDARGLMPASSLWSYDWDFDVAEMAAVAMTWNGQPSRIQLSNHSYGVACGWSHRLAIPRWYGAWPPAARESELFGAYTLDAQELDEVCHSAPYLLPFVAVGNDRTDRAPAPGVVFEYFDNGWRQKSYNPDTDPLGDGATSGGFNTLSPTATAKNVVTIGSVSDAVAAGRRSTGAARIENYSSFGPTDDGRIKPDLVANGQTLFSLSGGSDGGYATMSGTSMACANAAGAGGLLLQAYRRFLSGSHPRAATLKALLIHTADDLGRPGPDYTYGWGLINVEAAVARVRRHADWPFAGIVREASLGEGATFRAVVQARGGVPLRVTLCWTDPAGAVVSGLNDPLPNLVHDLDLSVFGAEGSFFPFVLDPTAPETPATTGSNRLDTVEQVTIVSPVPGAVYTIEVTAPPAMQTVVQWFSLVVDGGADALRIEHNPAPNPLATADSYRIECEVASESPLAAGMPRLLWRVAGESGFAIVPMTASGAARFEGAIPAHPLGTRIEYRIEAANTGSAFVSVPETPDGTLSFTVVSGAFLRIGGHPGAFGVATPAYGLHEFPVGATLRAFVTPFVNVNPSNRWFCTGWLGGGDAPASGAEPSFEFVLSSESSIEWQWTNQYSLALASTGVDVFSGTLWWNDGASASVSEPPLTHSGSGVEHRFVEWHLDGVRQPSPTNQALRALSGIAMTRPRAATAVYMNSAIDADADGLADWWERHFFGNLAQGANDDPDRDGYLNVEEFRGASSPVDPADVPRAPVIAHTPLPSPVGRPAPWLLSATVTSATPVDMVRLLWRRNGLSWRIAVMQPAGADTYAAAIGAPGIGGDVFEYAIEASNAAGLYVQTERFSFAVAYPVAALDRNAMFARLTVGQSSNAPLIVANSGTAPLNWMLDVSGVGWSNDVPYESEAPWSRGGVRDDWHISTNRAWSAPFAWRLGRKDALRYRPMTHAWLATPPISLGTGARLAFRHWPGMELDFIPGYAWDGGLVEVSTNGGVSFEVVTPVGGYPYRIRSNPDSPFTANQPCLSGTGGWERVEFDLGAYAGREVIVRFRFGSDGSVEGEGWYIDDVRVLPHATDATWLTLSDRLGLLEPGARAELTATFDSRGLAPGSVYDAVLYFDSNDPVSSRRRLPVTLDARSIPETTIQGARQISTNGRGFVAVTNRFIDADGGPAALAFRYATAPDGPWRPMRLQSGWIESAGTVTVPGDGNALGLSGFGVGSNAHTVVALWDSLADIGAGVCIPEVWVQAVPSDEWHTGTTVTGAPFLVDHEPPGRPSVVSAHSHTASVWSAQSTVSLAWTPASDGSGIGVAGYRVAATRAVVPMGQWETSGTNISVVLAPDGDQWQLNVAAVDRFGNLGAAQTFGPLYIDARPPSATNAVVELPKSDGGAYYVGETMIVRWNGFVDSGSGIAGYYFHRVDLGGTAFGFHTTNTSFEVEVVFPNATNEIYVWAYDRMGHIGTAATAARLVLAPNADYDRDGIPNRAEDIAGTSAMDPGSILTIESIDVMPGAEPVVRLSWKSVEGRFYTLLRRALHGSGETWTPLEGAIDMIGTGERLSATVPAGIGVSAFRLEVRR